MEQSISNKMITSYERKTGRQRESNLELFRIITMLLIVAHHYVVNSGLLGRIYENPMETQGRCSCWHLVHGASRESIDFC